MSVAAGRSVLQSAVVAHAAIRPTQARRCSQPSGEQSVKRQPLGHWQRPDSHTSVQAVLSRSRTIQFPPLQPQKSARRARSQSLRAAADSQAGPAQTAAAAEHAAAHPPLATFEYREGSPGASTSSDVSTAASLDTAPATPSWSAEAQVDALRTELQDMRELIRAQQALTAQQELTIASLQRGLLTTPSGSGPSDLGVQQSACSAYQF